MNRRTLIEINPEFQVPTHVYGARDKRVKGSFTPDRDTKIIELVNKGLTFDAVGSVYQITRERVRQIYKKYVGMSPVYMRTVVKKQQAIEQGKKYKFTCIFCDTPISYADGKGRNAICRTCFPSSSKDMARATFTAKCNGCGVEFNPTRIQLIKAKGEVDPRYKGRLYHSFDCFLHTPHAGFGAYDRDPNKHYGRPMGSRYPKKDLLTPIS